MLFHTLHAPRSGVYIQQIVGVLHEELNSCAFRQAWQWLVERHPVLRTSVGFADYSGELFQHVHMTREASLAAVEEHDWRGTDVAEREERLRLYLDADRRRGFELGAETPLMRVALFRMDRADYRFVWTSHHALLDGRSILRVLTELFCTYEAFCRGDAPPRYERVRPYRDYIHWLTTHADMAEAERFWRGALRGFSAPTPLVVDGGAPSRSASSDSEGFATRDARLSKGSTAALKRLARQHGLTLNTLVQGAWALLLSRYSGEEDIVFGATRACRTPETRPAEVWVGLFINTLPVRVRVSSDEPLIPWLQKLRAQWIAAREYEHTPLVNVHAWSEVPAGSPLFESMVMFEHQTLQCALQEQQGDERWAKREFRAITATHYPLTVWAFGGEELLLDIWFDRGRFEQSTIDRMLEHFRTLLEGIVADPERRISELPLLTEAERHQLLVEWNDTQTEYPADACIHELFEEQVERTPDAIAVAFEDQWLTYRELNRRANQLAHRLRDLGVGPEVLVGICVERSVEMVVGLLGILKVGGAYVPLDPTYPKERLSFMLADVQAPVVLTQERLLEGLPKHEAEVVCLDRDWEEIIREGSERNPQSSPTSENLAYVTYTSGSTGVPKGVMVEHRSVARLVKNTNYLQFHPDDVFLQLAPLSFDASTLEIWGPLLNGGQLALAPPGRLDLAELAASIRRHEVTTLWLTAGLFHLLLDAEPEALRGVRNLLAGGEVLSAAHVREALRCLPATTRLINGYGPTENTTFTCCFVMSAASWQPPPEGSIPIGRPVANSRVYILDDHLRPVPIGVVGELYAGGEGLARGYLSRPELTAEKFIPDPFSEEPGGARLYRTGDLARYLPDGNIEFVGRIDQQVKLRGFRIELGEIETVLGQHPAVGETVVAVWEDKPDDKRLVAYVVPTAHQQEPTTSELRDYLKERLPEYMVPSAFVALDVLPLTPNGKVDRRALPVPDPSSFRAAENAYVQPRTPVEEALVGIWEEVLEIEQVGIHDDFFELGGHSLLAVQVIVRLNEYFGVELPLRALFDAPTVAGLALIITQTKAEAEADIDQMLAQVEQMQSRSVSQKSYEGQ